ncbi:MAG: hypothetical protein ACXW1P_03125 [Methylophilaceae bacterium]
MRRITNLQLPPPWHADFAKATSWYSARPCMTTDVQIAVNGKTM